jgi:hypothetical protein
MVVDKEVGGNKKFPHRPAGIEVFHTLVVVGVVDHGVWWHRLVHLLSETSQVCLGQMALVLEGQGVLCTSTLTGHK